MPKVVIIGGGVAGMSAAHELLDRGFEVEVYEFRNVPGGKARSIPSPHTGVDGRQDLPGEHGFRFFPGFYKHVIDTMQRIPVKDPTGKCTCVADHLVSCPACYDGAVFRRSACFKHAFPPICCGH